ncbi:hypothetical protein BC332_19502 [Capsicum chinense]|nr:hypothetical protein BC332_19502 [Capsicum chinense]
MNPSCALSNLSSTVGFSRGTRPWDSEISVSAFQALLVHHFTHPIHDSSDGGLEGCQYRVMGKDLCYGQASLMGDPEQKVKPKAI